MTKTDQQRLSELLIIEEEEDPFKRINLHALNKEPNLSWKAKGLHYYIRSRPPGWKLWTKDLLRRSADGEASTRSGLQELISQNYLYRLPLRDPEKKFVIGSIHISFPKPTRLSSESLKEIIRAKSEELKAQQLESEKLDLGNLKLAPRALNSKKKKVQEENLKQEEVLFLKKEKERADEASAWLCEVPSELVSSMEEVPGKNSAGEEPPAWEETVTLRRRARLAAPPRKRLPIPVAPRVPPPAPATPTERPHVNVPVKGRVRLADADPEARAVFEHWNAQPNTVHHQERGTGVEKALWVLENVVLPKTQLARVQNAVTDFSDMAGKPQWYKVPRLGLHEFLTGERFVRGRRERQTPWLQRVLAGDPQDFLLRKDRNHEVTAELKDLWRISVLGLPAGDGGPKWTLREESQFLEAAAKLAEAREAGLLRRYFAEEPPVAQYCMHLIDALKDRYKNRFGTGHLCSGTTFNQVLPAYLKDRYDRGRVSPSDIDEVIDPVTGERSFSLSKFLACVGRNSTDPRDHRRSRDDYDDEITVPRYDEDMTLDHV